MVSRNATPQSSYYRRIFAKARQHIYAEIPVLSCYLHLHISEIMPRLKQFVLKQCHCLLNRDPDQCTYLRSRRSPIIVPFFTISLDEEQLANFCTVQQQQLQICKRANWVYVTSFFGIACCHRASWRSCRCPIISFSAGFFYPYV